MRQKLTLEDACRVQLAILERWVAMGEKHAGWKIGRLPGVPAGCLALRSRCMAIFWKAVAHEEIGTLIWLLFATGEQVFE